MDDRLSGSTWRPFRGKLVPMPTFCGGSARRQRPEADAAQSSDPRQQRGMFTGASVRRNRRQRDSAVLSSCHRARQPAMPRRAKPNGLNISIKETWPKTLELVCASAEWRKITLCTRAIAAGRTSSLVCQDAGRCIRARRLMFEEKATNPKVGGLVRPVSASATCQ